MYLFLIYLPLVWGSALLPCCCPSHRSPQVEALAGKRRRFFSYLKKTHQQGSFWLNCVKLTRKVSAYTEERNLTILSFEMREITTLLPFVVGYNLSYYSSLDVS